ncbi:MAG: LysE family translocator [Pseudomonadota bacterium]
MSIEALLLLAGALFLLAITPGPGVMLVVSRTLTGGLKQGIMATIGIVSADIIFLLLVFYGLQAIADSLSIVFTLIQYVGGLYLICLGISLLRSKAKVIELNPLDSKAEYRTSLLSGLIITLSNPKAILFYMSFLPAFIDIPSLSNRDIVIVGLVICGVIGGVMLLYALSTAKTQNLLSARAASITTKIAGCLIVATGGILIAKA